MLLSDTNLCNMSSTVASLDRFVKLVKITLKSAHNYGNAHIVVTALAVWVPYV